MTKITRSEKITIITLTKLIIFQEQVVEVFLSFTEMLTVLQQHRKVSYKNSQDVMIAASGYSEISNDILNTGFLSYQHLCRYNRVE